MNPDPNDFDQLRKLLAWKRHEVPPPGYFNSFSSRVIAQLTTPAHEPVRWWQRLGFDFDLRPALMCGVGIVVCGLLSFGVISAMQMAEPPAYAGGAFSHSPMSAPLVTGIAPVAAPEEPSTSIAPFISKQSSSPFNQFVLKATTVGFNTSGF